MEHQVERSTARAEELLQEIVFRVLANGEAVKTVAKSLRISPAYAHRLIRGARDRGALEVGVYLAPNPTRDLAAAIRQTYREYGIREAVVLPGPARDEEIDSVQYQAYMRHALATLAADYVSRLKPMSRTSQEEVENGGTHFCVSGGQLMLAVAQHFRPPSWAKRLVARPLAVRGYWTPTTTIDAAAVVESMQARLGSIVKTLSPSALPGMGWEASKNRTEVKATFGDDAIRPAFCMTDIGRIAKGGAYEALYAELLRYRAEQDVIRKNPSSVFRETDAKYFEAASKEIERLEIAAGLNWHGITKNGDVVADPDFIDRHTLALRPRILRKWANESTEVIALAHGSAWAAPLRATIYGKFFSTLIVDTAVAVRLVPLALRPEPYQDIPEIDDDEPSRDVERQGDKPTRKAATGKKRRRN